MPDDVIRPRPDEPSDETLVARVADGDHDAFRQLVRRLTPQGLAVATRMLGGPGEGEDVLQEAFLRLWRKAGDFDPHAGARLRTWFHRILVNLAIDASRRRRPHVDLDAAEGLADPRADERDTRARDVARALALLPEKQRAAVVLCYYEGLSNHEAAAALGASVHAVEALLVRGRRKLRELLLERNGEQA